MFIHATYIQNMAMLSVQAISAENSGTDRNRGVANFSGDRPHVAHAIARAMWGTMTNNNTRLSIRPTLYSTVTLFAKFLG
jgi:hypothetical protein